MISQRISSMRIQSLLTLAIAAPLLTSVGGVALLKSKKATRQPLPQHQQPATNANPVATKPRLIKIPVSLGP